MSVEHDVMEKITVQMQGPKTVKTAYFTATLDISNGEYPVVDVQVNANNQVKQDAYAMLIAMTIDKVIDNRNYQVQRALNALPKNLNQQQVQQKLPIMLKAVHNNDSKFHKTEIGDKDGKPVIFFYDRQVLGNNNKKYVRKLDRMGNLPAIEIKFDGIVGKFPKFQEFLDNDRNAVELEAMKVIEAAHAGAIAYINSQDEIARKELLAQNKRNNNKRRKGKRVA